MSRPTEKEKPLLKQFRGNVNDILHTEEQKSDAFLVRWIRARDHDLGKAEEMLRKSMKWREEFNVDKILATPFDPWFTENFPYWVVSRDKEGRPWMEIPLGAWDVRKAMEGGKEGEFHSHICRFFEDIIHKIREGNEKRGLNKEGEWPNTQWTVICDWKGYSYAQLMHWRSLQNVLKMAATLEAHYPEILYKCFYINCPSIFPLFMSLLKRIMAPKTIGKIQCFSGGVEEWGPVLLEEADKDQLGHLFGGERVMMLGDKRFEYPTN